MTCRSVLTPDDAPAVRYISSALAAWPSRATVDDNVSITSHIHIWSNLERDLKRTFDILCNALSYNLHTLRT